MKKFIIFFSALSIIFITSCGQHKTCPTYTKQAVKYSKVKAA